MRELLLQAATVADACDAADELIQSFEEGQVTPLEARLGLSVAYVECRKAVEVLAGRMVELEMASIHMREAA